MPLPKVTVYRSCRSCPAARLIWLKFKAGEPPAPGGLCGNFIERPVVRSGRGGGGLRRAQSSRLRRAQSSRTPPVSPAVRGAPRLCRFVALSADRCEGSRVPCRINERSFGVPQDDGHLFVSALNLESYEWIQYHATTCAVTAHRLPTACKAMGTEREPL